MAKIGSQAWNNEMFGEHPTPYQGIAGWLERQRLHAIVNLIREHHPEKEMKILELGCEAGGLLKVLRKAFPNAYLTGVDISDAALSIAATQLPSDRLMLNQADITLGFPRQQSWDIIICSETLEHIPNYEAALDTIESLLNDHTLLILTVPLEQLKNQVKFILRKLGLMKMLFRGIEEEFSAWHVNDFDSQTFKSLISSRFEILSYSHIWKLHQLVLAKQKNT